MPLENSLATSDSALVKPNFTENKPIVSVLQAASIKIIKALRELEAEVLFSSEVLFPSNAMMAIGIEASSSFI